MPANKNKKANAAAVNRVLFQNAIKTLMANIRFASVDNPYRVIGVTSAIPDEGKSTTAYSLAQAFASGGEKVLLLDCDLRGGSLASKIGVHPAIGLYSVLAGEASLEDAVEKISDGELYFLSAEKNVANPLEVISSHRFMRLVERLRRKYAYIIIDTPPLSTFVDGAVISQCTDGMLLVVRKDFTRREDVVDAYSQLQKADANVIGTVLNYCEPERHDYIYYNHYNMASHGADDVHVPGDQKNVSSTASMPAQPAVVGPVAAEPAVVEPAPELKPLPTLGADDGAEDTGDLGKGFGDSNDSDDTGTFGGAHSAYSPDSTMELLIKTGYQPSHAKTE